MYLLPQTSVDILDKQRTFFWQGGGQKRKYHLVRWSEICKSKKKGGLGIKDIRKMNLSLLCKWWWKLDNESGIWQDLIFAKYIKNDLVNTLKLKFDDSPVWKDLLKVRHIYLRGRKIKPNRGEKTLFWTDSWSNEGPLCMQYSVLFELCNDKNITIQKFRDNGGLLSFRRWLPTMLHDQWEEVRYKVLNQHLDEEPDKISWKWTKTGLFSVRLHMII